MARSYREQLAHHLARPHRGVRREPLTGPAAWLAPELRAEDWRVALNPAEIGEARRVVAACAGSPLAALSADDFAWRALAERIADWRSELLHGRGFVLVHGVPVADWTSAEAECFFWGLGLHLGSPGAQNGAGDLLVHVRDERDPAEGARYYSTNRALTFHTDSADAVGLLCLRQAERGGDSVIASSVSVYNTLLRTHPHLVERLYRPLYCDTFGEGAHAGALPIAPCRYADGVLRTVWLGDYFRSAARHRGVPPLSAEQRELIDTYDAVAASPEHRLDMPLAAGDIQLLNNHVILHGRTAFDDAAGRERDLIRLWLSL